MDCNQHRQPNEDGDRNFDDCPSGHVYDDQYADCEYDGSFNRDSDHHAHAEHHSISKSIVDLNRDGYNHANGDPDSNAR